MPLVAQLFEFDLLVDLQVFDLCLNQASLALIIVNLVFKFMNSFL